MKKFLSFFMMLMAIVISSCSEDQFEESETSAMETNAKLTRALVQEVSPSFDWENNTYINLPNIGDNIILPWYGGASTQIPTDILKDYKKRDGWVMLYNFCTPTASGKIDASKPYFIFYNVFTGQLRPFVYFNNNVTSGDMTLCQLSFNASTRLTNDFDSLVVAYDKGTSINNTQYVSNLTRVSTKSISRGWNCFDMDMAVYDPDIASKTIGMNIDLYDMQNFDFDGKGDITLNSEGTIVSITHNTSFPLGLGSLVAKGINAGASALSKLLHISEKAQGGVASAISSGANKLVNKFVGKKTTSMDSSFVKISTTGTETLTGKLTSSSQSNVSSLSQLMVPGSKLSSLYALTPSYNEPLGVWYLKSTPTIKVVYKSPSFVKDDSNIPPVHGEGGSRYTRMRVYFTFGIGNDKPVDVVLNPAILPLIDHYTVSTAIVGDISGYEPSKDSYQWPLGISSNAKIIGDKFVCEYEGTSATMSYSEKYASTVSIPNDNTEAQDYYKRYQNLMRATMPNNIGLLVSVTLYPKAPTYNPTPIVITRAIKCNIERP